MNKNKVNKSSALLGAVLAATLVSVPTTASAATFFRTGTINRVLTDSGNFSGCMVRISTTIGNGCPANGWVSLDCAGNFGDADAGKQAYSTALVALALGKQISVKVDNTKTGPSGFCVATRLDII